MDVGITDKIMQDIDAGMKSVKDTMPTEFKGVPSFVVSYTSMSSFNVAKVH